MIAKFEKSQLSGSIECPPSKSYMQRAIFIASLARGKKSEIDNALLSRDTLAAAALAENYGTIIETGEGKMKIEGPEKFRIIKNSVNAENSGTAIRIGTAIYSAISSNWVTLTGDSSLRTRPMKPMLDALKNAGVATRSDSGKPPISVKGPILKDEVTIDGKVSSQFISAFLIAATLTKKGLGVKVKGEMVSRPYIDSTISTMKAFGGNVDVVKDHKEYFVATQDFKSTTFSVPQDFSSMALLLSMATLVGNDLRIKLRHDNLPQGDKAFIKMLQDMGVKMKISEMIKVEAPEFLEGGRFNMGDTPDLVPPLAALAVKTKGTIDIFNAKHLRAKETDRIELIASEFRKVGLEVKTKNDGMAITNNGNLHGAKLDAKGDHRIFMALSILGMQIGGCEIEGADSVDVSYPGFIKELIAHNAKVKITN